MYRNWICMYHTPFPTYPRNHQRRRPPPPIRPRTPLSLFPTLFRHLLLPSRFSLGVRECVLQFIYLFYKKTQAPFLTCLLISPSLPLYFPLSHPLSSSFFPPPASHMAGLQAESPCEALQGECFYTNEEMWARISQTSLVNPPGSYPQYGFASVPLLSSLSTLLFTTPPPSDTRTQRPARCRRRATTPPRRSTPRHAVSGLAIGLTSPFSPSVPMRVRPQVHQRLQQGPRERGPYPPRGGRQAQRRAPPAPVVRPRLVLCPAAALTGLLPRFPSLASEISELMAVKSKFGGGGEFNPEWMPKVRLPPSQSLVPPSERPIAHRHIFLGRSTKSRPHPHLPPRLRPRA